MDFQIKDLGLIDYEKAYKLQKKYFAQVLAGENNIILFAEHPLVLTLGRMANAKYILSGKSELKKMKIKVVSVDRGGEVTLHNPGQLVIYPIIRLAGWYKDLKKYMFVLEQVAIDALKQYDILAERKNSFTGVWVGEKKIASIGIGIKKWISFHGMAINVSNDLVDFSIIKPCGLDITMTSIAREKNRQVSIEEVKKVIAKVLKERFSYNEKY